MARYIYLLKLRARTQEEELIDDNNENQFPLIYFMPFDFYKSITGKPESIYLKYFTTNKIQILFNQYDYVLIPVKLENSNTWNIASLSFSNCICSFYSCVFKQKCSNSAIQLLQTITNLFDGFLKSINMINVNSIREWNYHHIQPIAYADKSILCSLSLVCLDFIARGLSLTIKSDDLYYYTILIIIEVLNGKLYTY